MVKASVAYRLWKTSTYGRTRRQKIRMLWAFKKLILRMVWARIMSEIYKCPYCGRRFGNAIDRSRHVRKCPDRPDPVKR